MKELIKNLADDELQDMAEQNRRAANVAILCGDEDQANDLWIELKLIADELRRRRSH